MRYNEIKLVETTINEASGIFNRQPGQMFNVGRQFVTWKRGDVVQWPWYMPHATANASNIDRHLLTLIGF